MNTSPDVRRLRELGRQADMAGATPLRVQVVEIAARGPGMTSAIAFRSVSLEEPRLPFSFWGRSVSPEAARGNGLVSHRPRPLRNLSRGRPRAVRTAPAPVRR